MKGRAQRLVSLSPWVVSAGVVALLTGLAWDALLHRIDPDLAAREGIFTLTNPGHVLFGGGIAIIVAGALMFFVGRALTSPESRMFSLSATAIFALAMVSFSLAASTGTLGGPKHAHEGAALHTHDEHQGGAAPQVANADPNGGLVEDQSSHVHDGSQSPAAGQQDPASPVRDGLLHDHGQAVAITAAELDAAARLVSDTKAAAARFEDIEAARAEGYREVAPPRNGLVHYMNAAYNRDGRILDPGYPESLIYLKLSTGSWKLVGVMYRMPSPDEPGPRVGGPLTAWHSHDNLCLENGRVAAVAKNGQCAKGTLSTTPEMLHVWLVDNPDGVFSDDMEPAALVQLVESQPKP